MSWCESYSLSFTATHFPDFLNCVTDEQSRSSLDSSDWLLCRSSFRKLLAIRSSSGSCWKTDVHLFASKWNARLPFCHGWSSQTLLFWTFLFSQLEQIPGISVSLICSHSHMSGEVEEREVGTSGMPSMIQQTLVSSSVKSGLRQSPNFPLPPGTLCSCSCSSSTDNQQQRLTSAAYQSARRSRCFWNNGSNSDPLSGSVNQILHYLTGLHDEVKSYSTINLHRSMLYNTFDSIEGLPIGQHRLVKN